MTVPEFLAYLIALFRLLPPYCLLSKKGTPRWEYPAANTAWVAATETHGPRRYEPPNIYGCPRILRREIPVLL